MAKWIKVKDANDEQLSRFSIKGFLSAINIALTKNITIYSITDKDIEKDFYNILKAQKSEAGWVKLTGDYKNEKVSFYLVFSLKEKDFTLDIKNSIKSLIKIFKYDKPLENYARVYQKPLFGDYTFKFDFDNFSKDISSYTEGQYLFKTAEPVFFMSLLSRLNNNLKGYVEHRKASFELNIQGFDFSTYIC